METAFLEFDAVSKRYGSVLAVDGFSLQLRRNEFLTILGPSGCGKTTILRMVAGFIQPSAGEVLLEGRVISSNNRNVPPEKRDFGMVFQSFAVWPHMTVGQNVELPLRLRGLQVPEIKQRRNEALDLCRLAGLADRDPHQLSGGQLQRVALARALVYQPQLILLDEPLSSLDVALREELRAELHQIHQVTKATFVLVTHDQVEAMSLSDRVVVMKDGKIQQVGAPAEIYRSPETEFVARFVGSANILAGRVEGVADGEGSQAHLVRVGGMRLRITNCGDAQIGTPMKLAVHPEAIRVGEAAGMAADAVTTGRVKSVQFLGRTQEVSVEVHGVELRAMQIRGRSFAVDEVVPVSINEAAVIPLING